MCRRGLVLAFLVVTSSAQAATFNVGGFAGTVPIIDIRGPLVDGDDVKFDLFADALPRAVVRLDSPGGRLWAGLQIGEAIARKGYATFVSAGRVCASSCGFAWLAGQPRSKAPSAMVGFHGAYTEMDGHMESAGTANAMVGAYMTNLHLGYSAVVFATSAKPSDMLWLDPDTMRESGIAYEVRDEVETTLWAAQPALIKPPPAAAHSYSRPPGKPRPTPPKSASMADIYPKDTGGVSNSSDIKKLLRAAPDRH